VAAVRDDRREVRDILYRVKVTRSIEDVHGLRYCQEDIVLTNAQKWRDQQMDGATWRDLDSDLFSMIIVDEAHCLPAPQWKNIIDKFQQHAKVIFFTATPYRTDGRLITDSITTHGFAYELTDQKAVENGTIRKIRFTDNLIKFNDGEPWVKYNPKNSEVHLRYINEVIDAVINCVRSKEKECPLPGAAPHCALLMTANTSEAELAAKICQEKAPDLPVKHIHSMMKGKELKPVMKKFKCEEIRILVIVKKLLEGFNYPQISVVGIVTRVRSSLAFAQFIGRARRVIRGERNIAADVITHEYFEQVDRYEDFVKGHLIS
jgi:superfamily II DNA or RNA helicase